MKHKHKLSVKSRLVALMLLCWALPLLLLTVLNVYYLNGDRLENRVNKAVDQLTFMDHSALQRLDRAVTESRQASYEGELLELYEAYQDGELSERRLIAGSDRYMAEHYSRSDVVKMAVLWYREDPQLLRSKAYNTGDGATYYDVKRYWGEDHSEIRRLSETLDTRAALWQNGDRLYLVRNLYTPGYENAATLVLLLNQEYLFENYASFGGDMSITLELDGQTLQLSGEPVTPEETGQDEIDSSAGYSWNHRKMRIFHRVSTRDHALTSMVRFDDSTAFLPFYGYYTIMMVMAFCLLPLLSLLLYVFHRHISQPIEHLMQGAEQIEQGNLGYQLESVPPSSEFEYLTDSFNTMSRRLKHQFNHIYEEEVALRDARIKALQSHINPHFMNNTLEIINWEARLSGNEKVSQMIEALGTLMDAGIDRKKRPVIPLSEEMIYVNAYLHIISERLGSRVTIINEFPDEIMGHKVPRLILQPVIENAIEHGVVRRGRGTVILYGYEKGDFLYLEIVNESVLEKEDLEKISRLLDVNYDASRESSENLGIANVNQRLRILYGEPCGLTVTQMDEEHVLSRLCIRIGENASDFEQNDAKIANRPK